jgi:hypothetical protein
LIFNVLRGFIRGGEGVKTAKVLCGANALFLKKIFEKEKKKKRKNRKFLKKRF